MFTIHTLKLPNISSNRLLFDLAFPLKRVNNPKSWTRKKKKIEIFDERCFSVYMEKNRIRQSPTEIRLNKYITFDESFSHFYSCFNWYHIYNGVNKRRVKKAESHTHTITWYNKMLSCHHARYMVDCRCLGITDFCHFLTIFALFFTRHSVVHDVNIV